MTLLASPEIEHVSVASKKKQTPTRPFNSAIDAFPPEMNLGTTIGYELEVNRPQIVRDIRDLDGHSVPGFVIGTDHCGYEARSQVFKTWGEVQQGLGLIDRFRAHGCTSVIDCGHHIHVGRAGLGDEVTQAKFFLCLLLFQNFFARQIPLHRLGNGYCGMPSPQGYIDLVDTIRKEIAPGFQGVTGTLSEEGKAILPGVYSNALSRGYCFKPTFTPGVLDPYGAHVARHHMTEVHSVERSIALTYTPPVKDRALDESGQPMPRNAATGDRVSYGVYEGWLRLQPGFNTFEIRVFHASLNKTELFANLATIVAFVKKFKENPDHMIAEALRVTSSVQAMQDALGYELRALARFPHLLKSANRERTMFSVIGGVSGRHQILQSACPKMYQLWRMRDLSHGQILDLPDDFNL